MVERHCKSGEVFDEASVEVKEPKELLNVLFAFGGRPVGDGLYFLWVHAQGAIGDNDSKVFNFFNFEFTLLDLEEQVVGLEDM